MARTDDGTAAAIVPPGAGIDDLRAAAAGCRACDLWARGTQTVFGAGAEGARMLFVGEQPGDEEDRRGAPFVGPAGKLLDRALAEAGIDRRAVYMTNAVKHFKWVPKGKRRIHSKPSGREIRACKPWLEAEIEAVRPDVVVCLGATAAQALLGASFKVTERRGELIDAEGRRIAATVHPSSVLRAQDDESRRAAYEAFVDDLRRVAAALARR
jgi:uracil-DNA glycosylase family protein